MGAMERCAPGNVVSWMRPAAMQPGDAGAMRRGPHGFDATSCLQPTNTNPKNNFPASKPFVAAAYHLQNVALLPWYVGALGWSWRNYV